MLVVYYCLHIRLGMPSLPACVRIATPVKTNMTILTRNSTGYNRNCETPDGSSPIDLNDLSFFEFEKFVREYGESQMSILIKPRSHEQ